MAEQHHSKFLIIGAGPAGYTAAIYAARANLQPILVSRHPARRPADDHHRCRELPRLCRHHPGPLADGADAAAGASMSARASSSTMIVELDLRGGPFVAIGDSGDVYIADTVIIATGAQARWLGLPSEETSAALASRPAPPATASFSAARRSSSSAAATPRSRRRST